MDQKKKGRQKQLPANVVERNILRIEFEAKENLPALDGTRKQVSCARSIRLIFITRYVNQFEARKSDLNSGEIGNVERLFKRSKIRNRQKDG